MDGKIIFSIGHSNRSKEEFLSLLEKYGIEAIADVRRFPSSKFEIYKKENIKKILGKIEYLHFENLGGFRHGYAKWMETEEWRKDYEKLKKIAEIKKVAIMCAEKFPFRCHRRHILRKMEEEGWKVINII
ncbi:MAG: DUF488 domain-containing protein [Thermoplasmatales archaeon]|nr:DUF488 domain-containing protein [Thermoplasmatales archaeon]